MFDPKKPYTRRDEKFAQIIYTKADGSFVVVNSDEDVYICARSGTCDGLDRDFDLVNTPEKIEGWINIYKYSTLYDSEDAAKENADDDVFARVHLKVKKGEGL